MGTLLSSLAVVLEGNCSGLGAVLGPAEMGRGHSWEGLGLSFAVLGPVLARSPALLARCWTVLISGALQGVALTVPR